MLARERLAAWRAAEGISQAKAAERVGCSVDMYASIERGRRRPGRRLAHAIEDIAGVRSVAWDEDGAEAAE